MVSEVSVAGIVGMDGTTAPATDGTITLIVIAGTITMDRIKDGRRMMNILVKMY